MLKKWLIRFSGILVALLIILMVLPLAFKGKILEMAQKTASESVTAEIRFDDDLDLSLIRNFPNLSVGVNNLKVIGKDSFAGDTLFQSKNFRITIDIASVLSDAGPMKIRKIFLDEPKMYVHVLKSGRANYDIVPSDTTIVEEIDTAAAPISLMLKDIDVRNAQIRYNDASMGVDFSSIGANFKATGDFAEDVFTLGSHFTSAKTDLSYEGMTLVSKAKIDLKSDIQMDLNNFRFGFEPLEAKLNELPLLMKGWVQLNDSNMDMDMQISVPNSEFKSLLSAVPGCYTSDFAQVKTSGSMAFNMAIKGIMDEVKMPQTKVELKVNNAQFQYPALPKTVSGINIDFKLINEDGDPDHTTVDLKNFSLKLGNDPFQMSLFTQNPVSSPYARGSVKTSLKLDDWKQMLPLDSGMNLSGLVSFGLDFDGHYSSIESQKFDDLKVEGSFGLERFTVSAPDLLPTKINSLNITANPKAFNISPSSITYGSSTVNITEGRLENMLAYALKGETLKGALKIQSDHINLNEWMPAEETAAAEVAPEDTSALSAPQIPTNLDLVFAGNIGALDYENYKLSGCEAKIHIQNGQLEINPIKAKIWGSQIEFRTDYAYQEGGKPEIKAGFALTNLIPKNISQELKLIETFAPIMKDFDAPMNLSMDLVSSLEKDLSIDLNSVSADGLAAVLQATQLKSPEWLTQVFDQLKWNKGKMNDVKIKPGKLGFAINDGQLTLKDSIRLDVYEGSKMSFAGGVNLAQELNFKGFFYTQGKAVPMSIEGTTSKPKIKIDWKQLGLKVVEEYKEKAVTEVKKEANKIADKTIEEAEAKAAQLKQEAKEQADKMRAEGKRLAQNSRNETDRLVQAGLDKTKAEIETLKAKATNPLEKIAADKAAKKLNEEAQKKAEKLRKEGYTKAELIETEANKKADLLESETNDRAQKLIDDAKAQQQSKLK